MRGGGRRERERESKGTSGERLSCHEKIRVIRKNRLAAGE